MKKMNRMILASALMMSALVSAQAQNVSPVDFMRMNPYQLKANPATDLPYESVMSLIIGDVSVNLQNTTLRYDNLFDFDAQGRPAVVNLCKLANSLKTRNYLGLDVDYNFFYLGRRLKHGLLTYEHNIRAQALVNYNDGPFKLLAFGNSAFVGEDNPAAVNLNVQASLFQEFALGYQWNVNERLSLGGRAKLLFGVGNVNTLVADAKLFTDPDSYALRLEEAVAIRTSMPRAVTLKDGVIGGNGGFGVGDLFRNPGFGIDFGAEYRIDDQFSVVAAVRDLGFMRWSANNIEINSHIEDVGQFYDNGGFLFNGMDLEQLGLVFSDLEYQELFLDTLKQYFQLQYDRGASYTTMLNANFLVRGNYDLDANNRFSGQVQGLFYKGGFRPAVTLAYNGYFYNKLDVCVTYTMMPNSYDNLGIGISGRLFKTCNVFLTSNNVLSFLNPMNMSGLNVQAGIVFVLRPEDKNNEYE